jgi:hypothetical protein
MPIDLSADHDTFFYDFAEAGIVRPIGKRPRGVTIIVNRDEPDVYSDGGARVSARSIMVRNSTVDGMTPAEAMQRTSDQQHPDITFFWNQGDKTAVTRPISKVKRQNAGVVLLEVLS